MTPSSLFAADRAADPSPVEPSALEMLERVGGACLVRGLVDLYTGYAPARMAEARQALDRDDLEGVRRACRALRSGGAQLGLRRVVALCAETQTWEATDDRQVHRSALARLERELEAGLCFLAVHCPVGDA